MSLDRLGRCGGNGGYGNVYLYTTFDRNRMGSCDWLPEHGDMCIRVTHSGDFFHDYVALRKQPDNTFKRVGEFSAYVWGEPLCCLEERDFYLACAGEPIRLPIEHIKQL